MSRIIKQLLFVLIASLIYFCSILLFRKTGYNLKLAYVILSSDFKSLFLAIIMIHQLKINNCSSGDFVILLPQSFEKTAEPIAKLLGAKISAFDDSLPLFPIKYLVQSNSTYKRDIILWNKLRSWNLTHYNKIILLDSDMVILKNIDHLFYESELSGVPAIYEEEKILFWDPTKFNAFEKINFIRRDHDGLNGGLMVLQPNRETFEELVEYASNLTVRTCCPTQEFLFRYFEKRNKYKRLPPLYNMRKLYRRKDVNLRDIYVYHFVERRKPINLGRSASKSFYMADLWWKHVDDLIKIMQKYCRGKNENKNIECETFEDIKKNAISFGMD